MSETIVIDVPGTPHPQGSMRSFAHRHTGNIVTTHPARVYQWRAQVTVATQAAHPGPPLPGPLTLTATFRITRPASHYGTGRNANTLKATAPTHPHKPPDLDKLVRAICDAITDAATVWHDDAQVVTIHATKTYGTPGATITISPQ